MTGRSSFGFGLLLASTLGMAACGGTFKGSGGNEGGEPSGGTGSGGSSTGRRSCVFGGKTYADGATFMNDCNGCSCSDGEVACDARACDDGCDYAGQHYSAGQSFPAGDGCNTCTCVGGGVGCTTQLCVEPKCSEAEVAYGLAVDDARKCDPTAMGQCQAYLAEGLQCSCGVFVNGANVDAIARAKQAAASYSAASCGGDVLCGECATPAAGYCSQEGLCEALWEEGASACQVGGVVYPDGATNIPDPTSCNKCTCENGKLACTEISCPSPCPPDRVLSTQCAQCGPADACLVVEHACLPACSPNTDNCTQGACLDGVCRNLCG